MTQAELESVHGFGAATITNRATPVIRIAEGNIVTQRRPHIPHKSLVCNIRWTIPRNVRPTERIMRVQFLRPQLRGVDVPHWWVAAGIREVQGHGEPHLPQTVSATGGVGLC